MGDLEVDGVDGVDDDGVDGDDGDDDDGRALDVVNPSYKDTRSGPCNPDTGSFLPGLSFCR